MLLVLLAALLDGAAAGLGPRRLRGAWGFDEAALGAARYFYQAVDHFTEGSTAIWPQAYFTNDTFFSGNGPVFLYIGGEGPLSASSATSNFVVDWLPATGGMLYALEHRYYGCHNASSCPYDKKDSQLSIQDEMQYLTTDQALADLASFARAKQASANNRSPWVLIGGSYPGMLAAFARTRYPDVFDCAVASSAPVHAQFDFIGFQDVVTRGYQMNVEGVEGSSECAKQIAAGHQSIHSALGSPEGRIQLADLFGSSVPDAAWLEDPTNQRTFAGCGVASFPAQANQPACTSPACGVTQICEIMTDQSSGSAMERLAKVAAAQAAADMTTSCEMDWEMPGDIGSAADNYWGYQCCTEYGFYQTCELGSECFYAQGLVSFANADHQPDNYCASQFGLEREQTKGAVLASETKWTSLVANATKILWVNGDLDPWHNLSNLVSPGAEQPVIWPVKGARHCAWMSAAAPNDQQSIKDARAAIYTTVSEWLGLTHSK